ncbi:CGNR zinc finger domain-containing protein [Streptomyces sp. NPDC059718]
MASDPARRSTQPAPPAGDAQLVLDFTNSHADRFGRPERFADAAGLADWLAERGFADAATDVTAADAASARGLRDAVITLLLGHADDPHTSTQALAEAEEQLRRTATRHPLVTVIHGSGARLAPAQQGLPAALATVLAAIAHLALAGSWQRLKACRNPGCHFTFYDRSRNTSGAYCSNTCSTQVAMRSYRRRQRT